MSRAGVFVADVVDEKCVGEAQLAAQWAGEGHVVASGDALFGAVVLREVTFGYETLHWMARLVAA